MEKTGTKELIGVRNNELYAYSGKRFGLASWRCLFSKLRGASGHPGCWVVEGKTLL